MEGKPTFRPVANLLLSDPSCEYERMRCYPYQMRDFIRCMPCVVVAFATAARAQPDVASILNRISQTYKAVSNYELIANVTVRQAGARTNPSGHVLFAFRHPNEYRMETAMPGTESSDATLEKMTIVDDGVTVWSYLPDSNEYDALPASELTDGTAGDHGDLRPASMDNFMMWRYRSASDFIAGAKILRDEAIELAGGKVDCYVVTVSTKMGPYTWWVDKQNFYVLREDSTGSSSVFTTVKLNGPLPDDLFKFQPPPGARKSQN